MVGKDHDPLMLLARSRFERHFAGGESNREEWQSSLTVGMWSQSNASFIAC